jgi:DNA-binding winged helix-turn-helix (wHTH) protein
MGREPGEFGGNPVTVRFGPFTLDAARRQLRRAGLEVHLTPKAFDLLVLLVSNAPRVVGKAELHERLWPGTYVSDATLVGVVKELRRALDDRDRESPVIRTVHRVGYALALDVHEARPEPRREVWHWLVLRGRRVPLHHGENLVGRDPESHVWLDAAGVSRRHARLLVDEAGVRLEDLGSKNGTKVGEAPVGRVTTLRDGDRIAFGSVVAVYRGSAAGLSTETIGPHVPGRESGASQPVGRGKGEE